MAKRAAVKSSGSLPHSRIEKSLHREGFFSIAGVDEVGRGCLAGPVVAASVILPLKISIKGVNDSKKLTALQRESLFERILEQACAVGIGIIGPDVIDSINIFHASQRAMIESLKQLSITPDFVLVDGKFSLPVDFPQKAIISGDAISISIAAASIIAKVTRDRLMVDLEKQFHHFSFSIHKGYPTRRHRDELTLSGPTPIHRRSFRGVEDNFPIKELELKDGFD